MGTYDPSMDSAWTPKRQGNAGELSAINWLFSAGAEVCGPLFKNPDYDLIADFGDRVDRVQVKTSTCWRNTLGRDARDARRQPELERPREALGWARCDCRLRACG